MSRFESVMEVGKAARNAAEHFTGIEDFVAFARHVATSDTAVEKTIAQTGTDFLNPGLRQRATEGQLATYSLPVALRHLRGDNWPEKGVFSGDKVTNDYPMRRVEALIKEGTLNAFGVPGNEGPELRLLASSVRSQVLQDADRWAQSSVGDRPGRYRLLARNNFMHNHGYFTTSDAISGGVENFRRV